MTKKITFLVKIFVTEKKKKPTTTIFELKMLKLLKIMLTHNSRNCFFKKQNLLPKNHFFMATVNKTAISFLTCVTMAAICIFEFILIPVVVNLHLIGSIHIIRSDQVSETRYSLKMNSCHVCQSTSFYKYILIL